MLKFLMNAALLSLLFFGLSSMAGMPGGEPLIILAALSAAVCSLGPWLLPVSARDEMPRDEALQWCIRKFETWPGVGPLPIPPDGWTWMVSNLNKRPVLVASGGLITSGDWHDGF